MQNLNLAALILRLAAGASLALVPNAQAASDARLVHAVLAADQQVYALERTQRGALAEFAVFIGSQRNDLRLRKLSLRIDELPAVQYEYAEAEWQAIAAGGVHPAWIGALSEGPHRLRLELFARSVDAGPTEGRAVERLDRIIDVRHGGAIELSMKQERFGGSALAITEWNDQAATAADQPAHPWLRVAQFWIGSDQAYAAASLLKRLQLRAPTAPWSSEANALLESSLQRLVAPTRSNEATLAATAPFQSAVAALAAGDTQPLAALVEVEATHEIEWTRRDHAALLLGYHALRAGDRKAALDALGRVRSAGRHGTEALLGFGWAFLLPDQSGAPTAASLASSAGDTLQQPSFVQTAAQVRALPKEDRKKALERALVPWTELIGRDPLDPAAQEGALALAWALDELNTGAQAHLHYERAATQLERARSLLDQALQQVASGATAEAIARGQDTMSSGWLGWLADLPYADDTAYLKLLLGDARFIGALDGFRDAHRLSWELESARTRLLALGAGDASVAALQETIAASSITAGTAERAARAQMERVALDLLRAHKLQTERYLVEARLALARHFDNAPEPEREISRAGGRSS